MVQRPEDRSFESFFRDTYATTVAALAAAAGNGHDASDLAQDAYLQAYRRWAQVCTLDRPDAWVRRVALNKLIDRHRRATVFQRIAVRLRPADAEDRYPSDVDALHAAVADLPSRQREAVIRHYFDDRSLSDVAEDLGVSQGTVKSQLFDARRTLREIGDGIR